MDTLTQDLRYALRSLRRSRGVTLAAVLTLGLGMGASTAVFALLKRAVLDPLPYRESSRLVRLKNRVSGVGPGVEWDMSTAQYFYLREHATSLAAIGIYQTGGTNVAGQGGPERAVATVCNAGLLRLLGAPAAVGRLFDERDDAPGAPAVVVLSYGFWKREFGADGGVVGRRLSLNEQPHEIIGVLAQGAELPPERGSPISLHTDVWLPMRLNPAGPFWSEHAYPVIARLGSSATVESVQAEIGRLTAELPVAFPQVYSTAFFQRFGFHTLTYPLKRYVVGELGRNLWILFGAVGLVLLIACANVANLLLVRVESRRRETAIRTALGATRRTILRESFAQTLVLTVASAALALWVSAGGISLLTALSPSGVPRLDNLGLDAPALAFTLVLSSTVAAGLALIATLGAPLPSGLVALHEGGRSTTVGRERQRLRSKLVIAQVALALVLVVGAGLLIRSFALLRSVNPGVDPNGVLTVQVFLPRQRYDDMRRVWRFFDGVLARIRALPGVVAAGASQKLPFGGEYGCTSQWFEDQVVSQRIQERGLTNCAGPAATTPGYLEALGIPVLAGRTLTPDDIDHPARGAVIVSKAFASRFWPGENAIGKGVKSAESRPPFYHVVGVVGDVHGESLNEPAALAVYYPIVPNSPGWRWYLEGMYLVIRTTVVNPSSLLPAIRRAVGEVDPAIPLANAEEMQVIVGRSMSRLSFTMVLLGIAGAVALSLAAIGLYGTISYLVARRTNEIGVRLALGAQPVQVRRLVVRGSLKLTLVGVGIGLIGALALTGVLQTLLYGIQPTDPVAYGGAVLVLLAVAVAAAWVPARRAAGVDPMVALRSE